MTTEPVLLSELGEYEPISWYWEGFVAPRRKTIFVGHPKAGKTTLMSHLIKGLSGAGCAIGPPVSPCKTLILTEEHLDLWRRRRDELGIDGTQVWAKRIKRAQDYPTWVGIIAEAKNFMVAHGITTLVIDTLSSLWPCLDENDAAAVGVALDPLNKLADADMAVVCVHHAPKAKQSAVISARGSTAITAFFDIVINMRTAGRGSHTTRRSLKSWGRDLETPETLMLDYQGANGYTAYQPDDQIDEVQVQTYFVEANKIENMLKLHKYLEAEGPQTGKVLRDMLEVSFPTFKNLVVEAGNDHTIIRTGAGCKGSPYLYRLAPTTDK